jgi:hypothetical protein
MGSGLDENKNHTAEERAAIVANVRALAGLDELTGPDADHIYAGIRAFVDEFDYWYIRVMREAVPKYRRLIIERINPLVRRMELESLTPEEVASRLVEDYARRNFVTAGGWAMEALASSASPTTQKSPAVGIDLQRVEGDPENTHLYVLKSGTVTRNSDILAALKRNARQAERLLRQEKGKAGQVFAKYAIAAGKTTSTFDDGIWRPSSAEFWAEILEVSEEEAVRLVLALAAEAGALVRQDAEEYVESLEILVADYIRDEADPTAVDWEFIGSRTMSKRDAWREEDAARHTRALAALKASNVEPELTPGEAAQLEQAETHEGEPVEAEPPPPDA